VNRCGTVDVRRSALVKEHQAVVAPDRREAVMGRLERLTNIAVLIACAGLAIAFGRNLYLNSTARTGSFSRGERIELPGYPATTSAKPALVMILSTQCYFCKEGMPFYRALTAFHQAAPEDVRFLAVLPQTVSEANSYLERNGIHVDRVLSLPLEQIGVHGTPTLLLLDPHNKVEESWEGLLNNAGQAQVLERLKRLCGGCTPPSAARASTT
jgi:hypothetical protein